MPPVDFSVFTGAAQTPFGPDIQKVLQLQALQQRMQQFQQIQQGENTLRQLYQNKDNVDSTTNTLRPGAVGQLLQISPIAGQKYMEQAAQIQEREARSGYLRGQAYEKEQAVAHEIGSGALAVYNERLPIDGPKLALQRANDWYGDKRDEAAKSGAISPQSLEKMPKTVDPITFRSHETAYNAAHTKPLTQKDQIGFGFQAERLGVEKARLGLEAKKINVEQDKNLFSGKDAEGNDRTVRMGTGGGWVDAESNQPVTELKGVHKVGTKAEGSEKLPGSKQIAVVDKDGNVVSRMAAREGQSGWVHSEDPSKQVEIPPGGHVDVGQAAGAVIGSRENQMISRQLEGGITAMADLENVSKMPSTVSSGPFGGRKQGPSLVDAIKENLGNKLTGQQNRIYTAAVAGLERGLAVIETQGLAPQGAFTDSMKAYVIKDSDDQLTALYKMAGARQVVENGMEVLSANDRVGPAQRQLAKQIADRVKTAVPWTTSDVIKLDLAENPNSSLREMGIGKTGKGEASSQSGASPPVGIFGGVEGRRKKNDATGEVWELRGGTPVKVSP